MNVEVVPATQAHIDLILACCREREREAYDKIGHEAARDHLTHALALAAEAWTGFVDGQIVCMWGIDRASILCPSAFVWLLTADSIRQHPFVFVRHSQIRLAELRKRYHYIHGVVDASNTVSVKWLRWLGFQFSDVEFVNGYSIKRFSMVN
jgi:hypothetical protein